MQQNVTMAILKCNNENCDFAFIDTPNNQQSYVLQAYQPEGNRYQLSALQQEAVLAQAPTVPSQPIPKYARPHKPKKIKLLAA